MHKLSVSCLVVACLAANLYAIVTMRVFDLARSRQAFPALRRSLHFVGLSHTFGMQAHRDDETIRRRGSLMALKMTFCK